MKKIRFPSFNKDTIDFFMQFWARFHMEQGDSLNSFGNIASNFRFDGENLI